MKGCPLHCAWCQNPEGLTYALTATFDEKKCISCGNCGGVHNHQKASLCPAEALRAVGRDLTAQALVEEVLEDKDFFGTTGGITFSGGECLLQSDFVLECAKLLKKGGVSVAIDTCGAVDFADIEKLVPYTDLFLYDIKSISEDLHERFTGRTNKEILANFQKLYALGARIWVRVPIVQHFNASDEEIAKIKAFLDGYARVERIEPLRYHELGVRKYELLGLDYTLGEQAKVSDEDFEKIKTILSK
jgi:pyruvate formate lyase activating enzyme